MFRRKRQSQHPHNTKLFLCAVLACGRHSRHAVLKSTSIGAYVMNRTGRSPVYFMALTIFIDFAGFGIVLPLLPFWAERLGAGAVRVGLILTIYALAQFIFTPVLGTLSDRYGRRPVILASLLIEALSLALSALAGSLAILLVARFIGGLGASNIGSAQAVVADVTPVERRARGMGLIGAAIGLGFVVGPAMGGLLAPLGPAVPFWVKAGIAESSGGTIGGHQPPLYDRFYRDGGSLPAVYAAFLRLESHPKRVHLHLCRYRYCAHAGWSGRATRQALGRTQPVDRWLSNARCRASITLLEYEPGAVVGRPGHRKYRRWSSDTCGIGTSLIRQPTHEARRNTGSCTRCRRAGTNNRSTGCRKHLCDWRSGRTFHPW